MQSLTKFRMLSRHKNLFFFPFCWHRIFGYESEIKREVGIGFMACTQGFKELPKGLLTELCVISRSNGHRHVITIIMLLKFNWIRLRLIFTSSFYCLHTFLGLESNFYCISVIYGEVLVTYDCFCSKFTTEFKRRR